MKKKRGAKPAPPKAAAGRGRSPGSAPAVTVGKIMRSPVTTVRPSDTAAQVLALVQRQRIRHVPRVENDELVGVVTDRNLQTATTAPHVFALLLDFISSMDRTRVEDIMAPDVITATPDTPVADAARRMVERKIGCLPVIQAGKLVGIVTQEDLVKRLISA